MGIDVGSKITPVLQQAYGERFAAPAAFEAVLKDDRKGRKNGKGFYLYGGGRRGGKKPDPAIYPLLGVQPAMKLSEAQIAERCMMMMLNEAARCLDEGVIRSARDGDIGAVFGIGFPPFLGGPFRYIDQRGAANIVQTLRALMQQYGERFAPCEALLAAEKQERKFYIS